MSFSHLVLLRKLRPVTPERIIHPLLSYLDEWLHSLEQDYIKNPVVRSGSCCAYFVNSKPETKARNSPKKKKNGGPRPKTVNPIYTA